MSTPKIYKVKGMHCASCVSLIQNKVQKIEGVNTCDVGMSSEKATVTFKDNPVSIETINKTLHPFGYSFEDSEQVIKKTESHDHMKMIEQDQSKEMRYVVPMVILSFIMMLWDVLGDNKLVPEMNETIYEAFHHLMPIFATFILFGIGRKYIRAVWIFIKTRTANMDTLVGISTIVAFLYSFAVTAFDKVLAPYIDVTSNFYDVVIIVIGLIALGQTLEARAKKKTNEALQKLAELTSKSAIVEQNGKEIEIPIDQVVIGDIVVVKPNERIPVDGTIIFGASSIDESNLTGESVPVDKAINDVVFAGTQNFQGILKIRIEKDPRDTALSHIMKIVENAQNSKAPIERTADKISGYFVYVVLGIAVITFLSWIIFGPATLGFSKAFALALSTTMPGIWIKKNF
jgi:cation transport ATPase